MGIVTWIVLGLVAGLLAKIVMPGKDPGGIIVTILLGIAGALVGGFVGTPTWVRQHFRVRPAKRSDCDGRRTSTPVPQPVLETARGRLICNKAPRAER